MDKEIACLIVNVKQTNLALCIACVMFFIFLIKYLWKCLIIKFTKRFTYIFQLTVNYLVTFHYLYTILHTFHKDRIRNLLSRSNINRCRDGFFNLLIQNDTHLKILFQHRYRYTTILMPRHPVHPDFQDILQAHDLLFTFSSKYANASIQSLNPKCLCLASKMIRPLPQLHWYDHLFYYHQSSRLSPIRPKMTAKQKQVMYQILFALANLVKAILVVRLKVYLV